MVALNPEPSILNHEAGRTSWELSEPHPIKKLPGILPRCPSKRPRVRWPSPSAVGRPLLHADRVGGHLTLFEVLCRREINTPSLLMGCISPAARPPGTQGAQRSSEPLPATPAPRRPGAPRCGPQPCKMGASGCLSALLPTRWGTTAHNGAHCPRRNSASWPNKPHRTLARISTHIYMREKMNCYFYSYQIRPTKG